MAWEPRYSEAEARAAVEGSPSYSAALRQLGLRPAGGNIGTLKKLIAHYGLRTDHFDPNWSARVRRGPSKAIPLEQVLVEGSAYSRGRLKARLYAAGLKERRCELCGQGEAWRGRRMALILDHINGTGDDNRLENLRIVCPNCAATVDTHCGRKNVIRLKPRACLRCGDEFMAVGRKYGVSDNAVRKWLRAYEARNEQGNEREEAA